MTLEEYLPIKKHIKHVNKFYGQHFLIDKNILQKISNSISIENQKLIEIGGGIGNLTVFLLNKNPSSFTVIEKDNIYSNELKLKFPNIEVINDDCLNVEFCGDVLFGNLPYNISTQIIERMLLQRNVKSAVFLIQYEVALRLVAKERSKDYGPISVLNSVVCESKILFNVSANSFYPAPLVKSSVVLFHLNKEININLNGFLNFVKNAFKHRRKKFMSNLCADQISPEMYVELYNNTIFQNTRLCDRVKP
jgi:16S rRNA (adenine1518-N6/adenine1519-N6)-dimethyltransferase